MLRISYLFYRLASRLRYAVPRRFTPAGLLALTALGVTGIIGIDMDQTVAFQGVSVLLCLLAVAMLASLFFRGRFVAQRWLPRFGSVGQPLPYLVTVQNCGRRRQEHLELLEDLADPRPTLREFAVLQKQQPRSFLRVFSGHRTALSRRGPEVRRALTQPGALPSLEPGAKAEARMELLPLKRGPLRFQGLTVARADPLGWYRGFLRVRLPQTVLILPKRYGLSDIDLPGTRQYQQGGVTLAAAIGESEEFVALRDYRPGDPLRHIHWRSWARTGRPIVREFEDEFMVRHALILDTFAGPGQEAAFEEAVSVAASFACTVDTQEALLDLLFVGAQAVCFTTGRGLGQAEQALEFLASVQPCRTQSFGVLHELVLRHAGITCGCIVVLLAWDEPRREMVQRLRMLGLPLLVAVVASATELEEIRRTSAADRPERFFLLEAGKIPEGLEQMKGGLRR